MYSHCAMATPGGLAPRWPEGPCAPHCNAETFQRGAGEWGSSPPAVDGTAAGARGMRPPVPQANTQGWACAQRLQPFPAPPSLPRSARTWFPREKALLHPAGSLFVAWFCVFQKFLTFKEKSPEPKGYKLAIRLLSGPGLHSPLLFLLGRGRGLGTST